MLETPFQVPSAAGVLPPLSAVLLAWDEDDPSPPWGAATALASPTGLARRNVARHIEPSQLMKPSAHSAASWMSGTSGPSSASGTQPLEPQQTAASRCDPSTSVVEEDIDEAVG